MNIDDVTVIVRSVGERTEHLCRKLILEQGISDKNIFTVKEAPFSLAMRKAFKIGISQGLLWSFCIDADVLLRPGSIEHMLRVADKQKSNICEVQGYVLDKFFGGPRPAGNHLYRTSLLNEVIVRIPQEGVNIRPERYTLGEMKKDGFPWKQIPYIVGLHDDEQFNYDIYRKAFVQAVKHSNIAELLITYWKNNTSNDNDFKVALRGFADGINNFEKAFIDSSQEIYSNNFKKTGFQEKEPLVSENYSLDFIESKIINWQSPDIYFRFFPTSNGLNSSLSTVIREIKKSIHKRGFVRTIPLAMGELMLNVGKKIKSLAEA